MEVPVDAHLPAACVPRERLRLEAYRRLGGDRRFPMGELPRSKRVRLDRPERRRAAS